MSSIAIGSDQISYSSCFYCSINKPSTYDQLKLQSKTKCGSLWNVAHTSLSILLFNKNEKQEIRFMFLVLKQAKTDASNTMEQTVIEHWNAVEDCKTTDKCLIILLFLENK